MRRILAPAAVLGAVLIGPVAALATHVEHDPRPNPNCAWQAGHSVDWNGDGEPDHMVIGASHNTTFPRQVVVLAGLEKIPPFFGEHDGPDDAQVVIQGDHRMFGANPAHTEDGDPEQLHNGAIYARADYDRVEHLSPTTDEDGRIPTAEGGIGIYEANHLVMACAETGEDGSATHVAALCLNGVEIFRTPNAPECPQE